MHTVELVFAIGWAVFWLYWLVAAFSMKRGRVPWSRELRIRALIAVLVIVLIRFGAFRNHGLKTDPGAPASGSSFSPSVWGSRSGHECTSGATGAPRCRRRRTQS